MAKKKRTRISFRAAKPDDLSLFFAAATRSIMPPNGAMPSLFWTNERWREALSNADFILKELRDYLKDGEPLLHKWCNDPPDCVEPKILSKEVSLETFAEVAKHQIVNAILAAKARGIKATELELLYARFVNRDGTPGVRIDDFEAELISAERWLMLELARLDFPSDATKPAAAPQQRTARSRPQLRPAAMNILRYIGASKTIKTREELADQKISDGVYTPSDIRTIRAAVKTLLKAGLLRDDHGLAITDAGRDFLSA